MVSETRLSKAALSVAQRQIWAGQQIHPDVPLYNMAMCFRIGCTIDPARFAAAFDQLTAESDILRTVVTLQDGEPVQTTLDHAPASLIHREFSGVVAAEAWMSADCRAAFDLARGTWRAALLDPGDGTWIWYFNHHHVHCDILSTQNLYRRLSAIYAGVDDRGLPSVYADFLAHERGQAATADPAAEAWFAEREDNIAPLLYGRDGRSGSTQAARVSLPLFAPQSACIRDLATRPVFRALTPDMSHYTIFGTVLCAFLSRITGAEVLTLGTPVHNRPGPDFRRAAGMFTAVLPMQLPVAPEDSFTSLFARFRAEATGLLRHAGSGSARVSHQRAFNTVYNYITASFGDFAGLPCATVWLHPGHCDPHHHMRFQVEDLGRSGEFTLHFDLNRAVFDAEQREALLRHFQTFLGALLADLDAPVAALPVLTPAEEAAQERVLSGPVITRDKASLIEKISAQVAHAPDAVALRQGDEVCSYGDLGTRVDDLARALAARGIGPGQNVAVIIPRSMAAVVAILAIMKSGAAFVPLDPKAPSDRVEFQLRDMAARVVIAIDGETAPAPADIEVLVIDAAGRASLDAPRADTLAIVGPDDPAYVLYTSGSTGKPKGVVISNAAAAHYTSWAADSYCGDAKLSFALFTPLTFDLTITSLFLPLMTGGQMVIYPEADGPLDTSILAVVEDDLVDIVKLTPSHLRLIETRGLAASRIRQMIVGGEDFPTDLARSIHEASGGRIALHNEYGPTEATVGCIHHTFDLTTDQGPSVPIGQPIANMSARILNPLGQAMPMGVAGELWLGGDGLAEGYLNRPELSAESFGASPGGTGRLYRTGDLVRLDADGVLHYLGRIDQQLKLNGVRIEPGEVEAAIATHPAITGCVVIAAQTTVAPAAGEGFCPRCGLSATYPDAAFDSDGVCSLCRTFDGYRAAAQSYFDDLDGMLALMAPRRDPGAAYDCIALLSGGKDSTYMLGRLVDLGLRVLAFTLDNGFISDEAKTNIARVVGALGVDHIYGSTPAMNEIFVDSLRRHANVCHGCFKTIYTLSMQIAQERGIPYIVTGLSRGQFFETRLTPELFADGGVGCAAIDDIVLRARKASHRVRDAVSENLDVDLFRTDAIFDAVEFVDFYRYCDVSMAELYAYLDARLPWVRPSDTGRSTNCLINDVGIYVHKKERGYHNYALPYSWDVRLGHKERDAARDELDDDIDEAHVNAILKRIGYRPESAGQHVLTAYYTADGPVSVDELKAAAGNLLPDMMVPSHFVRLDAFPLSPNGKVDRKALAILRQADPEVKTAYVAPSTEVEQAMARIWQEVLKLPRIGVHHNFHDLGGDSINAIQIVARANAAGYTLRPGQLFDAPTVAELAALAEAHPVVPPAAPARTRRATARGDTSKLAGLLQSIDRKGGE